MPDKSKPGKQPSDVNPDADRQAEIDRELAATGGRAGDNPIAEMLEEGTSPVRPDKGQLRGDQTHGHRGGSQRETLNRGRD